jgi:hypothetical protein
MGGNPEIPLHDLSMPLMVEKMCKKYFIIMLKETVKALELCE